MIAQRQWKNGTSKQYEDTLDTLDTDRYFIYMNIKCQNRNILC